MGIGSVLSWMFFGLIAGAIARFLHPGRDAMGWLGTICLGVVGSLLGGVLSYFLHLGMRPYSPGGLIFSVIGAIVLLAGGFFSNRRRMLR